MKKLFKILSVVGLLFILTGCKDSTKQLVCTLDQSSSLNEGVNAEIEIVLKYEKDKITDEEENVYFKLDDSIDEDTINSMVEQLNTMCDNDSINFKNCKVSKENNTVTFKSTRSINDLNDADINEDTSFEDAKKVMENRGYTCK